MNKQNIFFMKQEMYSAILQIILVLISEE